MEKLVPPSSEVVDYEAKQLVDEHLKLSSLRETAKGLLYAASTPEERKANGDMYESIVGLNKDNIQAAHTFAEENLPELITQATNEATEAGHTITPYEEKKPEVHRVSGTVDLLKMIDNMKDVDGSARARLMFAKDYCEKMDYDPTHLTFEELMEIRAQPEWQNAQ